jgi:DNA modification methylase
MVMPGKIVATGRGRYVVRGTGRHKNKTLQKDLYESIAHPCARDLDHVQWLVKWFGGESVCDPFMGSGTTALACKKLGIPFVGIEIRREFCELAVSRLSQGVLGLEEELRIPLCLGTSESAERTV